MGILLFVLKYMYIVLLLKIINRFSWPAKIMASPFKVVCSHYILIPRAQPEVVLFLVSNESPYFPHYNPKFQLQIHYTLEVKAENVKCAYFRYTNFDFLMYFHNSLIQGLR